MPNWSEVQRMFNQAATPQEQAEAVRALAEHVSPSPTNNLVTMRKGGTNVVSLGDLRNAAQDPQVYERVKQIVTGG